MIYHKVYDNMTNMELYFIILTLFHTVFWSNDVYHVILVMSVSYQQGDIFSSAASWLQRAGLVQQHSTSKTPLGLSLKYLKQKKRRNWLSHFRGNSGRFRRKRKNSAVFFFLGGGAIEVQCSAGVKVQLERLSQPTRVINVASPQGSSWAECVCMNECVYVPACLCVFNNQPSWRQWVVQS